MIMMSHMTSQSYYEQFLIWLCSPEECPRTTLNSGKFSVNTHIIIIFAWYTYLGSTSRLKKIHVGASNVKVTRSLGNIDPNMAVTPSIKLYQIDIRL